MNIRTHAATRQPTIHAALGEMPDSVAASGLKSTGKTARAIDQLAQGSRRTLHDTHNAAGDAADAGTPDWQWLASQCDSPSVSPAQAAADARRHFSANPWTFVGFAVAAGLLLGQLRR